MGSKHVCVCVCVFLCIDLFLVVNPTLTHDLTGFFTLYFLSRLFFFFFLNTL